MFNTVKILVPFILFGLSVGLPIKDQEIDDLIYRLQDLKHQSHYGDDQSLQRSYDQLLNGGNAASINDDYMNNYARGLDSIGGGNLVRSLSNSANSRGLDAIGGANLLRHISSSNVRSLDKIGGGNLVRSSGDYNSNYNNGASLVRNLDRIGGGNLVRNVDHDEFNGNQLRNIDHIGGANLLKRNIDALGGAHLLKRSVDPLGGGFLLK